MKFEKKKLRLSISCVMVLSCFNAGIHAEESSVSFDRETRLLPEDATVHDMFGQSVAIADDTLLIGAWRNDLLDKISDPDYTGSAYIFERGKDFPWVQQATLRAEGGREEDAFGFSVALVSSNLALVGAPGEEGSGNKSGAVYLYEREGKQWRQTGKLLPGEKGDRSRFGHSLAVSGETLLVGAPHYNTERDGLARDQSGVVFIFVRDQKGQWQQQARLLADDRYGYDRFGSSVALDGDTAVIGAYLDDDLGEDSGSVYVFVRDDEEWEQQVKLLSEDGREGDWFGYSIAVYGDRLAVGASGDDDTGLDSGAVYLFERSWGGWRNTAKLVPEGLKLGSNFGRSIALEGDTLLAGAKTNIAQMKETGNKGRPGALYHYQSVASGEWKLADILTASYGQIYGEMGNSVAIGNGTVLTGAYHSQDRIKSYGAAYVFEAEPGPR